MEHSERRLKILTDSEIKDLYSIPVFSYEERKHYFSLNTLEKAELKQLRFVTSKVHFILQLGYFKAKKNVFILNGSDVTEDVQYIQQKYFPSADIDSIRKMEISKPTRLAHRVLILKLFDYRDCTEDIKALLQKKANHFTTISPKPIYIFRELMNYLDRHKIVLPSYSVMQALVGKAIANETTRLKVLAKKHIPDKIQFSLKKLLESEQLHMLHEITILRKEPKGFNWKEITREAKKQATLKPIYEFACDFSPKLKISNECIKYYASLVDYYTVYKLKRMPLPIVHIYLLCFVLNRYQKISNNLLNSLIYHVNKYKQEAKSEAKTKVYEYKIEGNKHLKSASKVLNLFMDDKISDETAFGKVKKMAFNFLDKKNFSLVTKHMAKTSFDEAEYEWEHYKNLSSEFKKNLRPAFLSVHFESQIKNDPLIQAVNFLKEAIRNKKSLSQFKPQNLPKHFVPPNLKRYLYKTKQIVVNKKLQKVRQLDVDRYEFLIYDLLTKGLQAGDVFCTDSTQFRSFEDELIDKKYWKKNKEKILKDLDFPKLKMPIEKILSQLEEELETKIVEVNKRIAEGKNKHIKITEKAAGIKWSLPYKKPEETENHSFYSHLPQIGIGNVLHFVNKECRYIEAFTHVLSRYMKNEKDTQAIIASLVALATNTGIRSMGEISDIPYQALYTAAKNFIRLETLRKANDIVSNAIAANPFFKKYDIEEGIIHSSSDGQKIETQIKTITSRHSPKYFGLKEGVTSYTLVANHVPINAKIIGANEHESHYVFDVLFNNTSEIKPDRHSTDTHGSNKANHLFLHMFDYMFAPRYKRLSNKADTICGFKDLSQYKDCIIVPTKKVRKELIIDEADNIFRILASLALKTTSQSVIVRKLSSYTRRNKTKQAIWEWNDILMSIYILDYVDDLTLRQNVQKAINRGESYHKLRKAVAHANSGKFRVKTELEQQIWNECARLVCNCIIFYNTWMLSTLHNQLEAMGRYDAARLIEKISPVAWRHINLRGNYKFQEISSVDLDQIVNALLKMSILEYSAEGEEYFN